MLISLAILVLLGLGVILRIWVILPKSNVSKEGRRDSNACRKIGVFLGSGGHTTEALSLLSSVPFDRYRPRIYFVSEGDAFSERKAEEFEEHKKASDTVYVKDYTIIIIPRTRRVHQPLLTTPPTALTSFLHSLYYMTYLPCVKSKPPVEVLIMNGPGTCFVLCAAVYVSKFLGIPSPRLIYVESFARVNRLSLSGKLLRPLVDRFVVQWPELLRDGRRGECRGWLV